MKILRKKQEWYKYINILLLVLYMIWIGICLLFGEGQQEIYREMLGNFGLFILLEALLFAVWGPQAYQKSKAKKYGKTYIGKVVDVIVRKNSKVSPYSKDYVYAIKIEFEMDGRVVNWEDGGYDENPREYISPNRSCKIYVYKNKYFLHNLEKNEHMENNYMSEIQLEYPMEKLPFLEDEELKKAEIERFESIDIRSQTTMAFIPRYFMFSDIAPLRILFIEVRMQSEKPYNAFDFDLIEKVDKYIEHIKNIYSFADEEKIHNEITDLVKNAILNVDNKVNIKEVLIMLK